MPPHHLPCRALVTPVRPKDIITPSVVVKELDLATMAPEDQDFSAEFVLVLGGPGARGSSQQCCAVVVWFDTDFTGRFCKGGWGMAAWLPGCLG
jgi:protein arginine N-methyltransferase 3